MLNDSWYGTQKTDNWLVMLNNYSCELYWIHDCTTCWNLTCCNGCLSTPDTRYEYSTAGWWCSITTSMKCSKSTVVVECGPVTAWKCGNIVLGQQQSLILEEHPFTKDQTCFFQYYNNTNVIWACGIQSSVNLTSTPDYYWVSRSWTHWTTISEWYNFGMGHGTHLKPIISAFWCNWTHLFEFQVIFSDSLSVQRFAVDNCEISTLGVLLSHLVAHRNLDSFPTRL
jgi:hypothetical protein